MKHTACTVCGRAVKARGLCDTHYRKLLRNGSPYGNRKPGPKPSNTAIACIACGGKPHAQGYCENCYRYARRYGLIGIVRPGRYKEGA